MSPKWVFENHKGTQVYYKAEVIDRIKKLVQETINKRPHSDNQIFENILEIIKEVDGNGQK